MISGGDEWTSSKPLALVFLDIKGSGVSLAEKEFILTRAAEELRQSSRYSIVEREIIDKLLEELNLSTSSLADPSTALKLGRILSAKLIATGTIARIDEEWLISLRFIETETTSLVSRETGPPQRYSTPNIVFWINSVTSGFSSK